MSTQPDAAPRVLFVDDEPAVLTGLGRVLRSLPAPMSAEFANSGAAALERMQHTPFDVIVADIRMPAMSGAELLELVRAQHPDTVRIVLSGHADAGTALRLVPGAHEYLAKPCNANALRTVIARARKLQALLRGEPLAAALAELEKLPARPKLYAELAKLLVDPSAVSRDIDKLVAQDQALQTAILQQVNLPCFALPRRASSIEMLIQYIGSNCLAALVLSTLSANLMAPRATRNGALPELPTQEALWAANLASQLLHDPTARDVAFAAALLQNVGELLVMAYGDAAALRALQHAQARATTLYVAEQALGSVSHAHLGAYLLEAWGLPYRVIEAVAHHHDPSVIEHTDLDSVDAVYAATLVAEHYLSQRSDGLELARAHLERCGAGERLTVLTQTAERWLRASLPP